MNWTKNAPVWVQCCLCCKMCCAAWVSYKTVSFSILRMAGVQVDQNVYELACIRVHLFPTKWALHPFRCVSMETFMCLEDMGMFWEPKVCFALASLW